MSNKIKDVKKDKSIDVNNVLSSFINESSDFLNEYRTFLVRKSERIASAVYVITGFIDRDDPIRLKLRSLALELITQSLTLGSTASEAFGGRCMEIAAILETARSGGLVSHMNAKIMCDEYASLASFAKTHSARISNQGDIESGTFLAAESIKDIRKSVKSPLIQEKNNKGHLDRINIIMSVFSRKDKISIKDISSDLNGFSSKTLQRDLLSLVKDGVLIKEGERRWSTYRKATS